MVVLYNRVLLVGFLIPSLLAEGSQSFRMSPVHRPNLVFCSQAVVQPLASPLDAPEAGAKSALARELTEFANRVPTTEPPLSKEELRDYLALLSDAAKEKRLFPVQVEMILRTRYPKMELATLGRYLRGESEVTQALVDAWSSILKEESVKVPTLRRNQKLLFKAQATQDRQDTIEQLRKDGLSETQANLAVDLLSNPVKEMWKKRRIVMAEFERDGLSTPTAARIAFLQKDPRGYIGGLKAVSGWLDGLLQPEGEVLEYLATVSGPDLRR